MDRRHWPNDRHAPPRDGSGGWVIVGEEPDGQVPPPRHGQPDYPPDQGAGGGPGYAPPAYDLPPYAAPAYEPAYQPPPYEAPQPGWGYGEPAYPPAPPAAGPYPPAGAWPPDAGWPPDPAPGPTQFREPRGPRDGWGPQEPPAPSEDEDLVDREPASWPVVLAWTLCYFLVPVLAYLGWAFTRGTAAPAACAGGPPCLSPRAEALAELIDTAPALAGALLLAVLVSLALRRLTGAWRAGTVGFAAAVIGAGIATLIARILA